MDYEINQFIKRTLRQHLTLSSNWFGNPKDSSFGINIDLFWDGELITGTAINFISE